MHLFSLPVETRLQIYSELLVHSEPITFLEESRGDLSSQLYAVGIDLCPALLRASKQVYGEAISLLYSDNCFWFPDLRVTPAQCHPMIVVFVQQIGAQANLLRHICIGFPIAPFEKYDEHSGWIGGLSSNESDEQLQKLRPDNLDLLRDSCPDITTLELSLPSEPADFVLFNSTVFAEFLDLIQRRLEAFQSLQKVKVDVELLGWDSDEKSGDGAEDDEGGEDDGQGDSGNGTWKTHKDSLRQLCSCGWDVNIKQLPPVKETWTSPNEMIEFDNEDDYADYMAEWYRREAEREDEEEEENYRQRQAESYRMDYADDGGPA